MESGRGGGERGRGEKEGANWSLCEFAQFRGAHGLQRLLGEKGGDRREG
jgi:hypothetical protein